MNGEVIVHAMVQYVACPACQAEIKGFVMDPRGAQGIECDHCHEKFDIPADARVVMD